MNGVMAGNDEPLPAVGHDDVSTLPGDAIAQFFKNSDGVTLVDSRNFWHNSNGDEFPGELQTFGFRLAPGIFLGNR